MRKRWGIAFFVCVLVGIGVVLYKTGPKGRKVLLIGVDAADWGIIEPMVARGELPHMARLMREGSYGVLRSIHPMFSPVLWTSIVTGKTPEKHGIAWHLVYTEERKRIPVTSNTRKVKALWNILSERGVKVGIIGWWASWPAEQVSGFIVTDHVAYHGFGVSAENVKVSTGRTYPEQMLPSVQALMRSPEDVGMEEMGRFVNIGEDEFRHVQRSEFNFFDPVSHFRQIYVTMEGYARIGLSLWGKYRPDFQAVYFEGIDSVCHLFMRYAPPRQRWVRDDQWDKYGKTVEAFYTYQDEIIGQYLNVVDEGTTVIVLSDHGFKTGVARTEKDEKIEFGTAHEAHRLDGIVMMKGPGIRAGHRISRASILDLAPTVLYLFGSPIARDMDGEVIREAFTSAYQEQNPVAYIDSYEETEMSDSERIARESPVDEEIKEKLRSLGYIGTDGEGPSVGIHNNLGILHLEKGRLHEALAEFEKVVHLQPDDAQGYANMGVVYREMGALSKAVRKLQYALMLAPDHVEARCDLADTYRRQGKQSKAISEYRRALEIHPTYGEAYSGLGTVYTMADSLDRAMEVLAQAIEVGPDLVSARYSLGVLYQRMGGLSEAMAEYRKAIEMDPNHGFAYNNLGTCYERAGLLDQAMAAHEKALGIDSTHAAAHYNLGIVRMKQGAYGEAISRFQRALELNLELIYGHSHLALAYLHIGDYGRAAGEFQLLSRLFPEDPAVWYQLARAEALVGNSGAAAEHFEHALRFGGEAYSKMSEQDRVFQYNLGVVGMEQGAYDEAIPRFERALELNPELIYGHSHLALAYLHVGDSGWAIEGFQFLSKLSPEDPAVWYQLARAEALAGNRDKAADLLRRSLVLEGDPDRQKSKQDTVFQGMELRIK